MPTYEYICEKCRWQFEQFQSISAKPLVKCPKCNKMGLKRLIGAGAGIIFKGSGFYQTDYRSEDYKKALSKESPGDKGEKDSKSAGKDKTKEKKSEAKTKDSKITGDKAKVDGKKKST
jgi:putative FmdB family regulatory protein